MDDYMTTDDRVEQVNWLRELAVNISENLGEGTAEELVAFAEGEGAVWGIDWPDWYDKADRALLVELVAEAL